MKKILFLFSSVLLFNSIFAQSKSDIIRYLTPINGISAQSIGMGYSNSLIATDNSALFLNPASLGMIKKTSLVVNLNTNQGSVVSDWGGTTNTQDFSNLKINEFSVSYPYPVLKGSFVLSFGYGQTENWDQVVKGGGFNPTSSFAESFSGFDPLEKIPEARKDVVISNKRANDFLYDWGYKSNLFQFEPYPGSADSLRQRSIVFGNVQQEYKSISEGGLNTWSVAVASEIVEGMFAGAVAHFINGDLSNRFSYTETDKNGYYKTHPETGFKDSYANFDGVFSSLLFEEKIDEKITGFSLKLGIAWKLTGEFLGGVSYTLPASMTVDSRHFQDLSMLAVSKTGTDYKVYGTDEPYDYSTSYDLKGGAVFEGNFAYNGFPLAIETGFSTQDWTNTRLVSSDESIDTDYFNDFFRFNVKRTWDLKVGIQYAVPIIQSFVKAGLYSQDSPYSDGGKRVNRLSAGYQFVSESGYSLDFGYIYNSASDSYVWYSPIYKPRVTYKEDQSYSSFAVGLAIKF